MSLVLKLDAAKAKSKTPDEVLRRVFPTWVKGSDFTPEMCLNFNRTIVRIAFYRDNEWSDIGRYTFGWNITYLHDGLHDHWFIAHDDWVEGEFPCL